ncbi:hypothetical protein ACRALDRAFT_1069900 [Sodiomyces alcalophilus JCM 7366]|uniref:uncharacterized protein n=1 Tax=Sodiomyces alcalophilus JCM 7366 TaxID=591952 RepID=UPI0039B6B23E
MFYSHDILTNPQHGVATIWLVATVGPRGGGRKVTRKAIQEVNVRKACEAISKPGAPIALRLQGNLLYGVSRVYSQQCAYVLNDAEKVQSNMKLFYRLIAHNETDPEAGKAKPEQNILEDDPSFIANPNLPRFDFGNDVNLFLKSQSQASSAKAYSQLSPMDKGTSSSRRASSLIGLNLPQSEGSSSLGFPFPFGFPSSAQKPDLSPARMDPMDGREDLDLMEVLELDIDTDGNVLGIVDHVEDELPPLPSQQAPHDEMAEMEQQGELKGRHGDGDEGDFFMMEDQQLPDAEAFPHSPQERIPETGLTFQRAGPTRQRRRDRVLAPDDVNYIPSALITARHRDYLARAERERADQRKITPAQARAFAYHITFGQGIAGIGRPIGVPGFEHPLARHFAGISLRNQIFGRLPSHEESLQRTFSQAFEDDEAEHGRHVRPRLEEVTPQPGQGHEDHDMGILLGDDSMAPEIGMEGQAPLDNRMSSSLMPWNRTPSVQPPSSVLGRGSKKRAESHRLTSSPRGNLIHPIERYSDAATASHHGSDPDHSLGLEGLADAEVTQDSQWIQAGLDTASGEFLTYLKAQANEIGAPRTGDRKQGRLWIDFQDIATPGKHAKSVAAQAFLHVLSLATKSRIGVEQVLEDSRPFGNISVGVDIGDMGHMDDIYD